MRLPWVGLIVLAVIVPGWVMWQQWRAAAADLAEAQAQLAGHRAAEVFRYGEVARQVEAAALDKDLQQGVGADAALSDYLRDGAGRVWP